MKPQSSQSYAKGYKVFASFAVKILSLCFLAFAFVLPSCSEEPEPQISNKDIEVEVTYADKEKVVCASSLENCSAHLPLVVYDSSERFLGVARFENSFPSQEDNYLLRIDIVDVDGESALSSEGRRLSYEIISGNPYYRIHGPLNRGRDCRVYDCPDAYVDLYAYRIDNEGRLYVKDVWLLGRNSDAYARDASQMRDLAFSRYEGKYTGPAIRAGNCPVDAEEKFDCSNEHGLYISYTFARTQTDILKIRVTDMDSAESQEIEAHIKPNPRALALSDECLSEEDSVLKWACVNSAELVPEAEIEVKDEDELRDSLPDGLAFAKSEYDLVHAVEFNSLAEAKRTFHSLRLSDRLQIRDGKLIHELEVEPIADQEGKCRFKPKQAGEHLGGSSSRGHFEPGAGYLEYGYTKYPFQPAYGGSAIFWSRYGKWHNGFTLVPPNGIFTDWGNSDISRKNIGKIGYMELDFIERWIYQQEDPYAVIHTYPTTSKALFRDGPIADGLKGYGYLTWPKGEAVGDGTSYAIRKGVEIAPGHFSSIGGVRFFVNGSSIALSSERVNDYLQGAAYTIATTGHIDSGEVNCDELDPTSIELDYIRYYKPRKGY